MTLRLNSQLFTGPVAKKTGEEIRALKQVFVRDREEYRPTIDRFRVDFDHYLEKRSEETHFPDISPTKEGNRPGGPLGQLCRPRLFRKQVFPFGHLHAAIDSTSFRVRPEVCPVTVLEIKLRFG